MLKSKGLAAKYGDERGLDDDGEQGDVVNRDAAAAKTGGGAVGGNSRGDDGGP